MGSPATSRVHHGGRRRDLTAAAGGITFLMLAGVENMDVLTAPGPDAPIGEILTLYTEDRATRAVTAIAGAAALAGYLVFVVGLWMRLRAAERAGHGWSTAALVAGAGGVAVAAVGQGAHIALIVQGGDGMLDPASARDLFDLDLSAQNVGGFFTAAFLAAVGVGARRHGGLPRLAVAAALALAPLVVVASLAGLTGGDAARALVVIAFGLASVWLLAVAVWLLLGDWEPARNDPPAMTLARLMCGAVAAAAGVSGIALLIVPEATEDYFAWGLAPAPSAALVGGFYLASAVVYFQGARSPWVATRALLIGILALTIPILVATLIHLDVFEFDRLAAWTWLFLFALFPPAAVVTLVGQPAPPDTPVRLGTGVRLALTGLAVVMAAVGVALWADPAGAAEWLPFAPPPLSGRVLAGWISVVAVLAAWCALRDRWEEARLALAVVTLLAVGALVATVRTAGDLGPPGRRAVFVAALVAWIVAAAALWAAAHRRASRTSP